MLIKLSNGGVIFLHQIFNTASKIFYPDKSFVKLKVPFECVNDIIELPGQRLLCSSIAADRAFVVDIATGDVIKSILLPRLPTHQSKTLTIGRMILLEDGLIAYTSTYAIGRDRGIALFDYHKEQLIAYNYENIDVRCLVALPDNRLAVGSNYNAELQGAIHIFTNQQQAISYQSSLVNVPNIQVHDIALDNNHNLLAFIMQDGWTHQEPHQGYIYNFDLSGIETNTPVKKHQDYLCDFSNYNTVNIGLTKKPPTIYSEQMFFQPRPDVVVNNNNSTDATLCPKSSECQQTIEPEFDSLSLGINLY